MLLLNITFGLLCTYRSSRPRRSQGRSQISYTEFFDSSDDDSSGDNESDDDCLLYQSSSSSNESMSVDSEGTDVAEPSTFPSTTSLYITTPTAVDKVANVVTPNSGRSAANSVRDDTGGRPLLPPLLDTDAGTRSSLLDVHPNPGILAPRPHPGDDDRCLKRAAR